MGFHFIAALALLAGPAGAIPVPCRCAQLPLDHYFEDAAIVLVARATAVTRATTRSAAPAHAGWVPAYSARGRLAAATYPGGCTP